MAILPLDTAEWPSRRYKVVYADPCWKYYGDPDKDQAAGKHYNGMTLDELSALPVGRLLAPPAVVFMWTTSPKLSESLDLIKRWGLHYIGVAFVWVKTTNDGRVIHGQGVRPSITKSTTEYVLAASTVKQGRPLPLLTEAQPQVILAPRPGGLHSSKPVEVREGIEALYGPMPRVELFCRGEPAPGWDGWGNEAGDLTVQPELAQSPALREKLVKQAEEGSMREVFDLAMSLDDEE
jgi:N6-adenosine-specific RNA methylase IME4